MITMKTKDQDDNDYENDYFDRDDDEREENDDDDDDDDCGEKYGDDPKLTFN